MTTGGNSRRRFPWELLAGLVLGVGLGILYSWIIAPVEYVDTAPSALRADFKDQYRTLISFAYQATGDLEQARSRLAELGDSNSVGALAEQVGRELDAGDPGGSAYAIALLAQALQPPTATNAASPTATPKTSPVASATVTYTPRPRLTPPTPILSPTPRPTRTATPTTGAPFLVSSLDTICENVLSGMVLQFEVRDSAGLPLPGMEIIISWDSGEEHIFTGLKPELGDGYADFVMAPGTLYTAQMATTSVAAPYLEVPSCQDAGGKSYWGNLRVVFQQP